MERPEKKEEIGWGKVIRVADHCMAHLQVERRYPKDIKQYTFEEVMKAIYGDDVFRWINKRL